jgi:iron complex transport system substrate-binding protein
MRIVSLNPLATDILDYCGIGWNLVGVTHLCSVPKNSPQATILTAGPRGKFHITDPELSDVAEGLTTFSVDIGQIIDCIPDIILADVVHPDRAQFIPWAEKVLKKRIGRSVTIHHLAIHSLEELYATVESVGQILRKTHLIARLVGDIKKHIYDWADKYTHLCKGKKVILLSETRPFIVETGWVDDLLHLFGTTTLERQTSCHSLEVTWRYLVEERPDVLFVAPYNANLAQSVRRLPALESSDGWDDLPAVKQGSVFFAPGTDIFRPGPRFLKGVAALITAMADVEKPIHHDQNDVYRIRYVEMFRHTLIGSQ